MIRYLQQNLDTEKGLPLEPVKETRSGKPVKGTKYLPLKKQKGKKKFTGRAGSKSAMMRKMFLVNVPVGAPKISKANKNKIDSKQQHCDCHGHEAQTEFEGNSPEAQNDASCADGLSRAQALWTELHHDLQHMWNHL